MEMGGILNIEACTIPTSRHNIYLDEILRDMLHASCVAEKLQERL